MILRNSCYLPNKNSEATQSMSGHRNLKRRCGESHLESPAGCAHGPAAACVLSKLVQLPTPPLSKHQLKRLEEHKYQSAGRSLLEPLMQGYWEWLVGRVPAWIAPNLITIIGLLINIFTTLLLVYYCPTATEQVSSGPLTACVVAVICKWLALFPAGLLCLWGAVSPRVAHSCHTDGCDAGACMQEEQCRFWGACVLLRAGGRVPVGQHVLCEMESSAKIAVGAAAVMDLLHDAAAPQGYA